MELTRVIVGPVITEKAETLKLDRTYVLKIAPKATKIDVKHALRKFFDVEAASIRVQIVGGKSRSVGPRSITKRKPYKKAFVTLTKDSKALDLAQFKVA